MSSILDELYARQKKESGQAKVEEAQRKKELNAEMKGLGLNEEEYNEFLEKRDAYKPSLYFVNTVLDDTIVNQFTERMSIFTAYILSRTNVFVSGLSGSGKTQLLTSCLDLVMPKDICLIEGGSEKNLLDRKHDIERCTWLIISEINKVDSALTIEYLKTAAEGKVYSYDRGGINKCHIELPPRCWAVSRATESATSNPIGIEMMSRLTEIVTDSSQDQTLDILDRKADNYQYPFRVNKINMVDRACLRWHISQIPKIDVCVNPAAKLLTKIVPSVFVSARRMYDTYVLNCEGISKFYWKERIIGEIFDKNVLFVCPSDIWMNHIIFGQNLIDAALQCSPNEKLLMKVIIENGQSTKQEIQQHLREYSLNLAIKVIETHLDHLSDLGYINIERISRENLYSATTFYKHFDLKPDMKKIVECAKHTMRTESLYEPFVDEYIDRFCDLNNMNVLNPFTGEVVNMLTYDFGNVFGVEEGTTRMKIVEQVEDIKKKSLNLTDFM
jgi:predicted transcriptional regulator